ncbi:MAG: DUF4350 domain-containing protein [Candidatus Dormibacteraeota bacterium]|nr:DUF4350 domain-containing protein [Candidatus Dormibacteraeota bacterium]
MRRVQPAAVLVVALLIIAVLAVLAIPAPSDDTDPSSRSAGKLGMLALYTWLGELGLNVSRVSGTFALTRADVLVEDDPTDDFSTADLNAITGFVRGGGDVIIAFDRPSQGQVLPLLQRLSVQIGRDVQAGTATPAQPFVPADDVRSVPMGAGVSFSGQQPLVPLLGQNGAVVAGVVQVGSGRAYVLGNSQPLSNDGLRHGDSAYLFLGLLSRARGGRIAFDEFHHGESDTAGGAAGIFNGPLGIATILAVALVLVTLAVTGRRIGRPVAAGDTALVPFATTYVCAMGDLFARSRQRGMIAARYADELKRVVGEQTGVASGLDDAAFVAALAAAGTQRSDEVASLLRRARELAAAQPDERALLLLARDVAVAEQEWAPAPQLQR